MNVLIKQRLAISILLFIFLFAITWPLYKYVFDVDGIGYIGAAKQYALGNFRLAVNGYWSPLHSWLIIPFIKLGVLPENAFRISNAAISIGCLVVLYFLIQKFEINDRIKSGIQYSFVIILLSYACYELAADLLLVFLLLLLFNLVLGNNFYCSTSKNALAGVIGALAFFAKAYAFPFFIVYFIFLHWFFNKEKRVFTVATGLIVFLLISFVWIYVLHWKYGEWMIAHGKNNYGNWDIKYKETTGALLLAPPYEGSPAIWEDPWKTEQLNFLHGSIAEIVLHQIRIFLFNIENWLKCLHEISFVSSAILLGSFIIYYRKKEKPWLFFLITVVSLSAGYLLLHVETRFLWPLTLLFLLAGAILLQKILSDTNATPKFQLLIWLIFFGSFLLQPVNSLKDTMYRGKALYQTSQKIKTSMPKGSFTSNTQIGECMVLAYLTGNSYYSYSRPSYSNNELLNEIEQFKIRNYLFFYQTQQQKEDFLKTAIFAKASKTKESEPGLIILTFY